MANYEQKVKGVLLGGCVGDVLGSQNEGLSYEQIIKRGIKTDFPKGKRYTDDTEMTLVLMRHMIENKGNLVMGKLHREYSDVIKSSARGYSEKTRNILTNYHEFMTAGNADTNGAVMRISPLAFYRWKSDEELRFAVKQAVYCTHGDSEDAVNTAFLYVTLLKFLINNLISTKDELIEATLSVIKRVVKNSALYTAVNLIPLVSFNENISVTESLFGHEFFQITAVHCFVCALYCFYTNFHNPQAAVVMAANMGGDTDTIAKLTGELAGAYHGCDWISYGWEHPEGYDVIQDMVKRLA